MNRFIAWTGALALLLGTWTAHAQDASPVDGDGMSTSSLRPLWPEVVVLANP